MLLCGRRDEQTAVKHMKIFDGRAWRGSQESGLGFWRCCARGRLATIECSKAPHLTNTDHRNCTVEGKTQSATWWLSTPRCRRAFAVSLTKTVLDCSHDRAGTG